MFRYILGNSTMSILHRCICYYCINVKKVIINKKNNDLNFKYKNEHDSSISKEARYKYDSMKSI